MSLRTTLSTKWKRRRARRLVLGHIQRWQNLISAMIALLAAAWTWSYTQRQIGLGLDQLQIATRQANIAQEQLRATERDQRPYLWPTVKGPPQLANNKALYWNWFVKNLGKSLATKVVLESFFQVGNSNFRRLPSMAATTASDNIFPPGEEHFATAFWPDALSSEDFQKWSRVTGGIKLLVILTFEDALEKRYEVTRCFQLLDTGAIANSGPSLCPGKIDR